jgi:cyclophilin family peptidyl-prolyl cis-trans isomerase
MKKSLLAALGALALPLPSMATDAPSPVTPSDIVAAAPASDWTAIAASDLMVMELAPDAKQRPRRVVIQMMPPPFSQGWVENVRALVAARWFDGTAVIRSQDNYVAQWGDPGGDDPKTAKALPPGLRVMAESQYVTPYSATMFTTVWAMGGRADAEQELVPVPPPPPGWRGFRDPYSDAFAFVGGFPVGMARTYRSILKSKPGYSGAMQSVFVTVASPTETWPIHCYGMVGVGRGLSPNTGDGSSLYVVNGTPPRQLDRNIALVGRVIEGMENLSTLPRGTGPLGFYETPEEYTPIVSVRMGGDVSGLPAYEYLSTESASFAAYANSRANRKDDFYITPAGGVDVCNVPVPVRHAGAAVKAVGK